MSRPAALAAVVRSLRRACPIAALAVLAACSTPRREEVARLEAENEELRRRLADVEQAVGVAPGTQDVAPAAATEWSWAEPLPPPRAPESDPPRRLEPPPQPPPSRDPAPARAPEPAPARTPAAPAPTPAAPTPAPVAPAPTPVAPAPTPAAPAPAPEPLLALGGTRLGLRLETPLSSGVNQVGDPVWATLASDVVDLEGRVVLPAGTRLTGSITEVKAARKVKRKSVLAFRLDAASLPDGRVVPVSASRRLEGEGYTKKDGAIIGGSAAGGAILGQVLGGDSEATAAGAVIGGAIGSGVVMGKKGEDVIIPEGTEMELQLASDVSVLPAS